MGLYQPYIVGVGEEIIDAVINSTGSIKNWDAILTANGLTDWTPQLTAGESLIIPDSVVIDPNGIAQFATYRSNNNGISNFLAVLQPVWDVINSLWILQQGFWNDAGIWLDGSQWNDTDPT